MPADRRPRTLGRTSSQARGHIASCSDAEFGAISFALDALVSGQEVAWDVLPQAESPTHPGRMALLLPSGNILVWQPYVDYPDRFAVFYIGPGSHFV